MVGSPLIAGYLAHVAFWILLAYGWAQDELTRGRVVRFLVLWLVGRLGLPYVPASDAVGGRSCGTSSSKGSPRAMRTSWPICSASVATA